ncbi:MAG TPA: penicillin-binding protein 2 [Gammaproteobacteria bacterium]|nr:penicillin-binding protein 2 [Gammaproteobacteria bacterium]
MAGSSLQFKDPWQEQRLFLSRVIAAAIIVLLLSGLLVTRLVQLQILDYERFAELSQGNSFRIDPVPPTRGLIYDRNGTVIAENRPNWELVATAEQIDNFDRTLRSLEVLGLVDPAEHDELRNLVRSHRGFERVKLSNLTEEQAATFAVRRHLFSGVDVQVALSRYYPFGEQTAHAIGYVGSISEQDLQRIDRSNYAGTSHIGKTGIERAYEDRLHGQVGYRQLVVNAQGRVIEGASVGGAGDTGGFESKSPSPGENLVLSLDMKLQIAAQEALGDSRGAVVAIDPRNGDVLALVSTPSFDANRFAAGMSRRDFVALNTDPDKPLFNRALTGIYPPGSTVKPFLALTALQHESVAPEHEIYCPGEWRLPGQTHRYREGRGGVHGNVDLHVAIVRSCDVYFYQLAVAMGIDNLSSGLTAFGFGAPTGLDIAGEQSGIVPSPEWKKRNFSRREDQVWFPGETVITGIGQGYMLVTPIQLASAGATFAARGTRFAPRLLLGAENAVTGDMSWVEPRALPGVEDHSPEHWQFVFDAMVGVTAEPRGTARAQMDGIEFTVAGKTGTAQVITIEQDEKYREEEIDERQRDHGLFVAFAPAEAPRIALGIVVENGGGGARAAAPVARKVLDAFFAGENYVAREP